MSAFPPPQPSGEQHPESELVELGLERVAEAIRECRRLRGELAAELAGNGYQESHLLILWYCSRRANRPADTTGVPQYELVEALAVSPAQMSHLLEQMRRRGWLESRRPATDRRTQHWRIVSAGEEQLRRWTSLLGGWAVQWRCLWQPPATDAAPPAGGLRIYPGESCAGGES